MSPPSYLSGIRRWSEERSLLKRWAPVFLVALGLLQMSGAILGSPILRGLGAMTAASPAPRVFTTMGGMEPYSTRFFLEYRGEDRREHALALTPERYAQLEGAYNRRNAYGAVVAAGPALATGEHTRPLFSAVSAYALCGEAPLLRELGIDPAEVASPITLRYLPREGLAFPEELPTELEIRCP